MLFQELMLGMLIFHNIPNLTLLALIVIAMEAGVILEETGLIQEIIQLQTPN